MMVDPYSAVRRLERFLGYNCIAHQQPPKQPIISPAERDTLIATIVYNPDNGTERIERVSDLERKTEE